LYDWAQQEFYLHNAAAVDLAERAVDLLRGGNDSLALGRALTLSAQINLRHLRTSVSVAQSSEAVAILEQQSDSAEYASALSALALVTWLYVEDVPASLEIVNQALEAAEASGDKRAEIQALIAKGNMQYSVGIAGGMELLETARSLAEKVGDRESETRALSNMTGMAADFRNMPLATDLARRTLETAARYDMRAAEAQTSAMYAEILLWNGKWDEVEDTASAAFGAQPYAETIAWRVLGTLQARRGRTETRIALDRMWALAESAEQLTVMDPAAAVLAEYLWLSGDDGSQWLESLDSVLAKGIEVGKPWPSGSLAFWMWKLGRLDSRPDGTFDFYGWIIDGEPERAVEFWHARGVPYEEALSRMHCGRDEQLRALRIAESLGADALASRIRGLLAADGVTPPRGFGRATRDHTAGLTQRQAEVLDLLAEGLTNADIADRLFLSPRTVENHVAAILMKLDAPTRARAVAAARERAIL
jgi:DNA-binding CsgD family transcriptional regulator